VKARTRDRRVYLRGHPVLFALLAATRGRPVTRLGGTLLVHDRDAFVTALTRIPLDRTAEGTTGGAADRLAGGGMLFDQQGDDHRHGRRAAAALLGTDRLRPVWTPVFAAAATALAAPGGRADLVPLAAEAAGRTAAALLGLDTDPGELARAAREAAATAARSHLPGPHTRRTRRAAVAAADRLTGLLAGHDDPALAAILVVAAVNTTVAALPRAVAWAADAGLWAYAGTHLPSLVSELLRVTAPSPLLPRVVAAGAPANALGARPGDRLLLIARHAAGAHRRGPDPADPAPARQAQLVFGAGPHACPGAGLARAQLADLLTALAPHRPVVIRARADRRSALPGWSSLVVGGSGESRGQPVKVGGSW
jgi:cytochrome P450